MTKRLRGSFSFMTMTMLVFVLISLAMWSDVSSSAREDLSFGWLQLHRERLDWSANHIDPCLLLLGLLLAFGLTWVLSKLSLKRMLKPGFHSRVGYV